MARFDGFLGGAAPGRDVEVSAQRCINLYPEVDPLSQGAALVGCPGTQLFCDLSPLPVRGMFAISDTRLLAVAGETLFEVDAAGAATVRGTLGSTSGRVAMAGNGLQVMLSDGAGKGYIFDLQDNTLAAITAVGAPTSSQVAFIDGYFIANRAGTGAFQISDLYEGLTWNALDIQSAESDPDGLVAVAPLRRQLYALGQHTTEVFYNSGEALFPFSRIAGGVLEAGCAAPNSVARLGGSLYWLGRNKQGQGFVLRVQGYEPMRVTSPAIEHRWRNFNLASAVAYAYTHAGHGFYVITFPDDGETWVYDDSNGAWHQRSTLGLGRHLGECYAFFAGRHLVGDCRFGKLHLLSEDCYSDGGEPIIRTRTARNLLGPDYETLTFDSFEVNFAGGVGNDDCPNPQAMLRYSDDGGHTWSDELWAEIGAGGEYATRAKWWRLGQGRDRVFEVTVSDPVKVLMIGAAINGKE